MNRPTCARPLPIPSGANTSVKSRRPRVMKKNLSTLSQSWLNHVFSVFLSANQKRLPCQMICSRVNSVLSVPGVKPLLPPSDVLVGIHCNTTVILATFPPERPRCHAFQKSHIPCTKRDDSQPTVAGSGMTHSMERLLTTGAPSASYFSAQERRPHEKQPQASWHGPRRA